MVCNESIETPIANGLVSVNFLFGINPHDFKLTAQGLITPYHTPDIMWNGQCLHL